MADAARARSDGALPTTRSVARAIIGPAGQDRDRAGGENAERRGRADRGERRETDGRDEQAAAD
jgi:hypothetical protein